MDLTGKVALVTGGWGRGGLGDAVVLRLSALGCAVYSPSRSQLDVTKADDVEKALSIMSRVYGRIDILVNCAGSLGTLDSASEVEWEDWCETIAVNFLGAVNLCRVTTPYMKAFGGKIINISGGNVPRASPLMAAYGAAKTALVQFTMSLAEEVKQFGIDVNAVAPGPMKTQMYDKLEAAGLAKPTDNPQTPWRAAELICWLASSGSDGLTGRYLSARHDPFPFDAATISEIMKSERYTLRRS